MIRPGVNLEVLTHVIRFDGFFSFLDADEVVSSLQAVCSL